MAKTMTSAGTAKKEKTSAENTPRDDNRREDLLKAAAKLFNEKGFDGASMRAIADAVGMRCGSPFYHYPSKQALLVAVMEEGLREGLELTEAALDPSLSAREQFKKLVRVHLGILLDEGQDFIPVMLYNWRAVDDVNKKRLIKTKDRYDAIWQEVIERLQQEGLLSKKSKIARLMTLGAMNFIATWYKPGGPWTLDQLTDEVVEFFID